MSDFAISDICELIRGYIVEIRASLYNGRDIATAKLLLTKLKYALNMIKDDSISTYNDKCDILELFALGEMTIIENYIKAVRVMDDKEDFKKKTLYV